MRPTGACTRRRSGLGRRARRTASRPNPFTGVVGASGAAAVPALAKALSDADPQVRYYCVRALGKIHKEAHAAIPALKQAAQDPVENVRKAAAEALKKITSKDK